MNRRELAGNLRERITVQRRVAERDSLGAAIPQMDVVGSYWAFAKTAENGEESHAESRTALQHWRFELRFTNDILPGDELVWGTRVMIVRTVSTEHQPVSKSLLLAEEKR